jgi:hypothetical protein
LENLWVVRKQNSIRIFFGFFHWCMHKRYVSYRVNMAEGEGRAGSGESAEAGGGREDWPHSNVKVE